jgi:hypothetical protein
MADIGRYGDEVLSVDMQNGFWLLLFDMQNGKVNMNNVVRFQMLVVCEYAECVVVVVFRYAV